ncbi:hypothetical protein HC237_03975 [Ochrobactrum intermedium]|jgi:hypothetical protein|uniref:Uncharacterized protein n=1 Tax=Brucella pseudintermedia TaxID=370111 RepID=A0ABY5UFF9_9HYPH|nr:MULTISPECIES: hypothetical protein [Brucella/Ochrobactrum group]NKE74598.1 hypothetical protein [Ochrobactrum sp. MC-1LL]UWL62031.1 hypothetical protein NIK97_19385 [Brucella pseudintermedia]WPM82503.1 hypothetical protein R5W60_15175 [Brucella pseudintermedia]
MNPSAFIVTASARKSAWILAKHDAQLQNLKRRSALPDLRRFDTLPHVRARFDLIGSVGALVFILTRIFSENRFTLFGMRSDVGNLS